VNNFVIKCIENIFYLIFSTETNQKKHVYFFVRVSIPLIFDRFDVCGCFIYFYFHILMFFVDLFFQLCSEIVIFAILFVLFCGSVLATRSKYLMFLSVFF